MAKTRILLSGIVSFRPVGRHALSFIDVLSENNQYEIFLDVNYLDFRNNEIE